MKTLKAFTFVELVIVIVLISVLSAMTLPFILSSAQGSDANDTVRRLFSDIYSAQQDAYSRKGNANNCSGVNLSTLTSRTYTLFSGIWDSSTGLCNSRQNQTVTLPGRSTATSTLSTDIIFPPGKVRPHTNIQVSGTIPNTPNNSQLIITSGVFSPALLVGDIVTLSSAPTEYAIVNTVNSPSSFNVTMLNPNQDGSGLGNGASGQTLNIAPNNVQVTVTNGTKIYVLNFTNEGQLYIQKTT